MPKCSFLSYSLICTTKSNLLVKYLWLCVMKTLCCLFEHPDQPSIATQAQPMVWSWRRGCLFGQPIGDRGSICGNLFEDSHYLCRSVWWHYWCVKHTCLDSDERKNQGNGEALTMAVKLDIWLLSMFFFFHTKVN